jgi:hypothetical protein
MVFCWFVFFDKTKTSTRRTQKVGKMAETVSSNPSEPSGYYRYYHHNIQQFYFLPTQRIYVFCMDLRTNSNVIPIMKGFYNRDGEFTARYELGL